MPRFSKNLPLVHLGFEHVLCDQFNPYSRSEFVLSNLNATADLYTVSQSLDFKLKLFS